MSFITLDINLHWLFRFDNLGIKTKSITFFAFIRKNPNFY